MQQPPWNPPEPEPTYTRDAGAGRLNFNQLSVPTTAAVEIAGNNPKRRSLIVTNGDSTNPIFVGDSNGVTAAIGHRIPAGASLALGFYRGPLWAIASGGAVSTTWLEESD